MEPNINGLIIPRSVSIFCVNDPYIYSESIKDEERELRQRSMGQIPNVFMKKEDVYPIPKDLKVILAGNDNKIRIQKLVKEEFIKVTTNRSIIWSVGTSSEDLRSSEEKPEFECQHAKADTILISMYHILRQLRENG